MDLFEWKCCENYIGYKVETVINGQLVNCYCCDNHLDRTYNKLIGVINKCKYPIINTLLTIQNRQNQYLAIHFGDVQFGPQTEHEHYEQQYKQFCVEMDRIGSLHIPGSMQYELLNNNLHDSNCCDCFQ